MSTSSSACAGCHQRDFLIEQLQARLAEAEAEIARLRSLVGAKSREQTRQAGHFRRRKLKKRRKKSGRKSGHPAAVRPTPIPDRLINVPLEQCPDCQVPLVHCATVTQFQTDLPPIVPIVTQFNLQTGYCKRCGHYHQARHPEQTSDAIGAAGNTIGPVILTMAAELKHRLGVPYRKICDFFAIYCDLRICPATFVHAEQRLTEQTLPTYQLRPELYQRRVQQVEDALATWLERVPLDGSDDLRRLVKHVCSHRGEWLVFLHDAEVPPTNNHAESMLRPAVITRKVGGCNKTLLGAVVHGVLASLMVTCKRQGRRFLDLAKRLFRSEDPEAIPLETLPIQT